MAFWFIFIECLLNFLDANFQINSFSKSCPPYWWCYRFSCSPRVLGISFPWVSGSRFFTKLGMWSVMLCSLCRIGEHFVSTLRCDGLPGFWRCCMPLQMNITSPLCRSGIPQRLMYWSMIISARWFHCGRRDCLQNKNNQLQEIWLFNGNCWLPKTTSGLLEFHLDLFLIIPIFHTVNFDLAEKIFLISIDSIALDKFEHC